MHRSIRYVLMITLLASVAVAGLLARQTPGYANVAQTRISSDPFTNAAGQHRTEVGPDIAAGGSRSLFTVFQAGRSVTGGSAGVGFARTDDRGGYWYAAGFLDGITVHKGGGAYTGVSDVAVAFRVNYNRWLVSSLATGGPGGSSAVLISVTWTGGLVWRGPYTVATGQLTNSWVHCDNWSPSFSGRCYAGYSVSDAGNAMRIHTSVDGGVTWGPARASADNAAGLASRPIILRSGTVILPYLTGNNQIRAIRSTDGGVTWQSSTLAATVQHHVVAGGLRASPSPSMQLDNGGIGYLAWSDCRFRSGCAANDIVFSTTTNGTTWTAPRRVPITSTAGAADHFAPGFGVDPASWGTDVRIGLTYAFYPNANCTPSTCQLSFGFISSTNAAASWSAPVQIAGPMSLSWLPDTSRGRMFADNLTTVVMPYGNALPSLPIAFAPSGGQLDQALYVPTGGLALTGGSVRG
jgi:hypothetical protein